jgi:amino acid transporter
MQTKKSLGVFSLVMINVIAVDSLRSLPFSASYGFSLVFYYIVAALVFFLPISLLVAELATGWPSKGGIYVWVKEAFGERWGFAVIWLQWIYNVVWYPTILAFIAATCAYVIHPSLAENKIYLVASVLTVFWIATFVNCFGMRLSSHVSSLCAIFGTLLPMLFIIVLGIIWMTSHHPLQIQFTSSQFFPKVIDIGQLSFLLAILFGLVGMEMSASHADEVKNPEKSFPRAISLSTIIIFVTLVLSSLAIALVVPAKQLNIVTGLIQAFSLFFNSYHLFWMTPIITVLIVIGGIGSVAAWVIGPTKGLLIAAIDGNIPKVFAKINRHGSPVILLILQAAFCTLLCMVFLLMPTVSSSYWVLTAITAQFAMMVYIAMFAAGLYLHYKKPAVVRSYKIPFGSFGIWSVCIIGILTCLFAIALGFIPPTQMSTGKLWRYETILVLGLIILCLPPFFIAMFYQKRKEKLI